MALQKEIINELGVKTTYHRIDTMTKKNDVLEVTIASYVDKSYREKEEEIENTISQMDTLVRRRDELENNFNRTEDEEKELKELYERTMNAVKNVNVSYVAWSNLVTINKPQIAHISFEDVYTFLKTIEPYIGAKDC